jgi:hypothetical protein
MKGVAKAEKIRDFEWVLKGVFSIEVLKGVFINGVLKGVFNIEGCVLKGVFNIEVFLLLKVFSGRFDFPKCPPH